MTTDSSTLKITTSYIWFSFFQAFCHPIVEIDGESHRTKWGTNSFPVTPGNHTISVYHRWLFFQKAYESTISVEIPKNQTVFLHWHTGWFAMSPGKWLKV